MSDHVMFIMQQVMHHPQLVKIRRHEGELIPGTNLKDLPHMADISWVEPHWKTNEIGLSNISEDAQRATCCLLQYKTWNVNINSHSASHNNWCTATLWNRTMTAQCEGMGEVGSARYEPALLPPCPSIRVLSYSNCQEIHSRQKTGLPV